MLRLRPGDPDGPEPASFTRFLLPFAWRKHACPAVADDVLHFAADPPHPVSERLHARRTYFTPETTLVLFERASWLRAVNWHAREHRVAIGDRTVAFTIAPPRAVLFESHNPDIAHLDTGFLIVEITFQSDVQFNELLRLNEVFRYWRKPYSSHCDAARLLGADVPVYHSLWEELLRLPVRDRNGDTFRVVTKQDVHDARKWIRRGCGAPGWICYTDPRAFVYSCAISDEGVANLDGDAPELSGPWVRFVNVDCPSTAPATPFERKSVTDRTYGRWKHAGTLYGFSAHSAVMLGSPCKDPDTWRHFADMYFDQVLLLLYLRVTTFRFSALLSSISLRLASGRRRQTDIVRREFAALRREFALFTNLYRFPLLSNQQQGIEMYSCARKALDVDELFEEVQKEIESTHELFELTTAARHQEAATALGWIAAVASAAGVALAFAATNVGGETADHFERWLHAAFPAFPLDGRFAFMLGTSVALFAPFALWRFFRRNR